MSFNTLNFKVRDIYDCGDYLVLVTTDRQSAFDRILASIPFKGQVYSLFLFSYWLSISSNSCNLKVEYTSTIEAVCNHSGKLLRFVGA